MTTDQPAILADGVVLVLASASPRRLELLRRLGVEPVVAPSDIDETPLPGESPTEYVLRLAVDKCSAVSADPEAVVIGADTTIDLDGDILAKPADVDEARSMLRRQSGRTHRVHTGVAVRRGEVLRSRVVTTLVTMQPITDEMLDWYVATGEPLDKAGAYAIQGAGGVLVDRVVGSVSNVVGLPLAEVVAMVREILV